MCIRGQVVQRPAGNMVHEHIPGLKAIVDACHQYGAVVMIQIHHAGIKSPTSVTDRPVAPSPVEGNTACELTVEEIEEIDIVLFETRSG